AGSEDPEEDQEEDQQVDRAEFFRTQVGEDLAGYAAAPIFVIGAGSLSGPERRRHALRVVAVRSRDRGLVAWNLRRRIFDVAVAHLTRPKDANARKPIFPISPPVSTRSPVSGLAGEPTLGSPFQSSSLRDGNRIP